ncbi:hypothetical protein Krac_0517 [Ktedonobacter racemifer DSM 44963]|uniref:Uncharacterized protein n=1 Tax=Ktedonobacter racemifer DSM 44963 TaxID=485913 RepID=D6U7X3_KTERA|nr:hypothetical protein Krac_0517 [Ktedonobacter racemifer DSM 44963]
MLPEAHRESSIKPHHDLYTTFGMASADAFFSFPQLKVICLLEYHCVHIFVRNYLCVKIPYPKRNLRSDNTGIARAFGTKPS